MLKNFKVKSSDVTHWQQRKDSCEAIGGSLAILRTHKHMDMLNYYYTRGARHVLAYIGLFHNKTVPPMYRYLSFCKEKKRKRT